jgi:hypothetical protein
VLALDADWLCWSSFDLLEHPAGALRQSRIPVGHPLAVGQQLRVGQGLARDEERVKHALLVCRGRAEGLTAGEPDLA